MNAVSIVILLAVPIIFVFAEPYLIGFMDGLRDAHRQWKAGR